MKLQFICIGLVALAISFCAEKPAQKESQAASISRDTEGVIPDSLEVATLAGGCFWKMDACYQQVKGIKSLAVGYAGGTVKNPTYEQVGSQKTGHAESIKLVFDPKVVSYNTILDIFWSIHDPTQFNREGNDVGNDYRSVVFYHSDKQRQIAEAVKDSLNKAHAFKSEIITEIEPYKNFYKAEDYHQNYYNLHPTEVYCMSVVRAKVKHFEEKFKGLF